MTVTNTGASSTHEEAWHAIKWCFVESHVKRLQMRIAKATQEKRYGKVRALQWLLTHSYSAKLLAVRRVTSNKGAKTPGVDGIIWNTAKRKSEAVKELQRRGYRAQPLRRVYIPKKKGQRRALGIPTLRDRAMQALHLLALEPVAEITADPNSYGFRTERSTQDAIEYCFMTLSRRNCAEWILEADIQSCFDHISHEWLQTHVVTDRRVLQQWLKAGYLEKQQFFFTEEGTPQGGIISPTLANIVLDGLERTVKAASIKKEKVNITRYADDFIVTGASPEVLERLKGVIELFLAERGLKLSAKKTKITSVYQGFDFLGFNVKKHKNFALLIKPAKASIKKIRAIVREVTRRNVGIPTVGLIRQLNPKLQGWANYYRYVIASRAFAAIDHEVFTAVWRWARHRHPKKNATWIRAYYFRQ
jgi:RNA-directed DNA polymerase